MGIEIDCGRPHRRSELIFTTEGGTLHQAVKPVMDKTNMPANTVETAEGA